MLLRAKVGRKPVEETGCLLNYVGFGSEFRKDEVVFSGRTRHDDRRGERPGGCVGIDKISLGCRPCSMQKGACDGVDGPICLLCWFTKQMQLFACTGTGDIEQAT